MGKAYQVVKDFETEIANWAGAKYGVAVSSCCNSIFLSLKYRKETNLNLVAIHCPCKTYPGVPMAIMNSGYKLFLEKMEWNGNYTLDPSAIVDSALRFKKNMYIKNSLYCLSFHYKKHLPIGRGGMILTDDKKAMEWLKMARFDGRKEVPLCQDNAEILGWNMYLEPSQAARGLTLFENIKDKNLPDLKVESQHYPDLTKWRIFNEK